MVFVNAVRRVLFGCLLLGVAAGAASALAAPSLSDALRGREDSRRAPAPTVARYVAESGSSFVIDRSARRVLLLKYENSPEVWVLNAHAGPRGDIIYKNDLGEPVLRATRLGGMTIFSAKQPGGAAAAMTGESAPLKLAMIGPAELIHRIRIAATRAGRAAQRQIDIEFAADSESAPLIADAALVLSDSIIRISARSDGRRLLSNFGKIRIEAAKKPSVSISDKRVLEIRVTPAMGLAGRPSSERIAYAAGAR